MRNGKKHMDYTKYEFKGKQYGKAKLVLAVIKNYIEHHPGITVDEIQKKFPKKQLRAPFELVERVSNIRKKSLRRRFFFNADQIIKSDHNKIVVTNQWSKDNIDDFIKLVNKNLKIKINAI